MFQCQSNKSKHTIDSDVEGAKQYLLLETSRVMEINWVSLTDKKTSCDVGMRIDAKSIRAAVGSVRIR